jgi:hypothetical protein
MTETEDAYYRRRASEEEQAANAATDQRVRQAHTDLAKRYSDAAEGLSEEDLPSPSSGPAIGPEFRIIP